MINKILFIFICIQMLSCTQTAETTSLNPNSNEMILFSERLNQKFGDYANASGYYQYKDSVKSAGKLQRGPCGDNFEQYFLISSVNSEGIILTFDKSDSCIIFSLTQNDSTYWLPLKGIDIPKGKFLFKYNNTIDVLIKD